MIKKVGPTDILAKQYGYNLGCLEGVNPFELGDIPPNDGVHHPADRALLLKKPV